MYDFKSRVRYSEVNSERQLTLPALIDYLQNCCTFQSEDMNIGVEYLEQHHAAWVLSSWEIVMNRYPKLAEHITVSTWPYSFKGFYGYRNFTIKMKRERSVHLPIPSGFTWILPRCVRCGSQKKCRMLISR